MKTQKIKVEIEAEVPVGEHCMNYKGIHCDEFISLGSYHNKTDGLTCNIYRGVELEQISDEFNTDTYVLKCQTCLDACKK